MAAAAPRPVSSESPASGRGGAATRLLRISSFWPRWRRDSSPPNLQLSGRGGAAIRPKHHFESPRGRATGVGREERARAAVDGLVRKRGAERRRVRVLRRPLPIDGRRQDRVGLRRARRIETEHEDLVVLAEAQQVRPLGLAVVYQGDVEALLHPTKV